MKTASSFICHHPLGGFSHTSSSAAHRLSVFIGFAAFLWLNSFNGCGISRFFSGGKQSANRADVANEDGPAPGDVVVTGVPVDPEVAESEAASSAEVAAAGVDLMVMTQQVRDQRAEIAEAHMRQFRPNICLLNNDQILRHACDIAMAPDWMQNTYNTLPGPLLASMSC